VSVPRNLTKLILLLPYSDVPFGSHSHHFYKKGKTARKRIKSKMSLYSFPELTVEKLLIKTRSEYIQFKTEMGTNRITN